MNCSNCGEELPAGAAICHNCGATQDVVMPSPRAAEPNPPPNVAPAIALPVPSPVVQRPTPVSRWPESGAPIGSLHATSRSSFVAVSPERSTGLVVVVLALLALGAIFAYAKPSISAGEYGSVSLTYIMHYYPKKWLPWLANLGIAGATVAALAFKDDRRMAQALCITGGCLLVLPFVFHLASLFDDFNVPVHLGSGLWLAMLCFAAASAAPWIAMKNAS